MTRKLVLTALCACVMCPALARAQDPVSDALATIPSEAMGFVCVPSVSRLDADLQGTLTAMQMQMMVPPPYNSLASTIRMFIQTGEHFDESGPLSLVMLPAETSDDLENKVAFIVPATDGKAMLEAMGGEAGEGGVWSVKVFGDDSFAIAEDKRAIIAPTADAAKAVAAAKTGIAKKLKKTDVKAMENLDLIVWVDGEALVKLFREQIDGFLSMLQMMQAAGGQMASPEQAEAQKKQLNKLIDGMSSVTLGLSLSEAGLGARVAMTLKPGSEMYKDSKLTKTTTQSLLTGLPGENSMVALGAIWDPALGAKMMEETNPFQHVPSDAEKIDQEQLQRLKGAVEELAGMTAGLRCSVVSLPPGLAGLIGATLIVDTTDSAKFLEQLGTAIDACKQLPTDAVDEDIKSAVAALAYDTEAEDIAGVKVQHLKFDLSQIKEIDEEDLEGPMKIIGADGILLRLAAADAKTVVVGFGGGAAYMEQAIKTAKDKTTPLDNDPGVKKVAGQLPKDRASVAYVAVDRIVACVQSAMKVLEEEEGLPFQMPIVNAPLAIVFSGGTGWSQGDVFIPMELLVQGKQIVMTMMMGGAMAPGMAPGAAPPPGGPVPQPVTPRQE